MAEQESEKKKGKGKQSPKVQRCYYEILELSRKADEEEIKKAWKRSALKWHPDKNLDRVEEANEMFKEVQRAYAVLSDPDSRAWYDSHRLQILRGESSMNEGNNQEDENDEDEGGINIWPFFSANCFNGFTDSEEDFFYIYNDLFTKIDESERENNEDEEEFDGEKEEEEEKQEEKSDIEEFDDIDDVLNQQKKKKEKKKSKTTKKNKKEKETEEERNSAPKFGTSQTSWENVSNFYSYWKYFISSKSFSHKDKYNRSEAPDRRTKRAMDKENKKLRDKAKRSYSDKVRHLVDFVYKTDPRVKTHKLETAKKAKEEEEKEIQRKKEREEREVEERKKTAEEREKALAEEIERLKLEQKGTGEYNPFIDDDEMESLRQKVVSEVEQNNEDDDEDETFCKVCQKTFGNAQQLKNHKETRKHKEVLRSLIAEVSLPGEEITPELDEILDDGNSTTPKQKGSKGKKKNKKQQQTKTKEENPTPQAPIPISDIQTSEKMKEEEIESSETASTTSTNGNNASMTDKKQRRLERRAKKEQRKQKQEELYHSITAQQIHDAFEATEEEERNGKKGGGGKKKIAKIVIENGCNTCGLIFETRNALFKHLKESGHQLRL